MSNLEKVNEVLKQLYAQRKVKLLFQNPIDREDFRQRLYKYKRIQDKAALAVLDEVRQVLRYQSSAEDSLDKKSVNWYATFWLEDKKEISFEIISIEETPVKDAHGGNEKKISADLGVADSRSDESTTG